MAVNSPLKGREMPGHKYIKRVMGKNGKWQYTYTSLSNSSNTAKSVSNIRRNTGYTSKTFNLSDSSNSKAPYSYRYVKLSNISPSTIAKGKSKASSKVRTSSEEWDKKVTAAKIAEPSKEEYRESAEKIERELNDRINANEKYYTDLYNQEKESVRDKLLNSLKLKYQDEIPEEEMSRINEQVEKDTKKLWEDVYQPLVDKVNDAIKANRDAVLRLLKKKYDQEE